jgi:hypothetical protein
MIEVLCIVLQAAWQELGERDGARRQKRALQKEASRPGRSSGSSQRQGPQPQSSSSSICRQGQQ